MLNTEPQSKSVAEVIRAAREAQSLSQREFADKLAVSHNSVALWERGEVEPTDDRIHSWLKDNRDWVRELGVRVFSIKFGPMLARMVSGNTPPSAA